jgi:4-hydroxy-3-polyprenylbenzoate decarboxylase
VLFRSGVIEKVKSVLQRTDKDRKIRVTIIVDHIVDIDDLFMVTWQLLGNSDPQRDHDFISPVSLLIDGTIKAYRKGGFSRKWPNVVTSDSKTISSVDQKWLSLGIGEFVSSPSLRYNRLSRKGTDEVIIE